MRLRRLGLECYGNFATTMLDLEDQPGCINLVVAPNGAGKSVIRQGMAELLFGIHPQTPMGFQFDYARMRLIATAVFGAGEPIGFVRRKGRANTLTDLSGQPAHPNLLARMPHEGDRKRLERLFVLDSAQLRAGGKALLQTDGDLADALLSGAGELGSARMLAADLAARRDAAAPMRKSVRTPFYEASDALAAANVRLGDTLVRPQTVADQERLRDEAIADRERAARAFRAVTAELARLSRLRSTRRHLQALDDATAWLEQHADAPLLTADIGQALHEAKQAMEAARREEAANRDIAASLAERLTTIALDEAALREATAIERLVADIGTSEQSSTDIPKREAELAGATLAIARLLRDLSSPCDPANAKTEMRAMADIATARALIAEAADLAGARSKSQAALARESEALAAAEDELASLPVPAQTDALRAALDAALSEGDPARQRTMAEQRVADLQATLDLAIARVPGGRRDPAALAALPFVAEATWTRLDQALSEARSLAAAAEQSRAADAEELAAARTRLSDLTQAGPLPDAKALDEARAHRDRGWALVFARLSGSPSPGAEAAYSPDLSLALAVERAIAAADAIADRRAGEVERLATAAQLQAALDRASAKLAASEALLTARQAAASEALCGWAAATVLVGLTAASSLAEIRALMVAREAVLASASAAEAARAALAALTQRQSGWAARVAAAMDAPEHAPGGDLPALIPAARHRLAEADRIAARRESLDQARVKAQRAVTRAAPILAAADAAMADWTARWNDVLVRLRRPAGEAPNVTAAVLDQLVALPGKVDAAETAQQRLLEMHDQLRRFAQECGALAERLDETAGEPVAVALRLRARLDAARKSFTTHQTLAQQAQDIANLQHAAATRVAEADRKLQAAISAAGAAGIEDAQRRVALAAEWAVHEADRGDALRRLREDGEGLDLATLRQEAEATPAGAAAEAMQAAEGRMNAARAAEQDAVARIERADGELRSLAAGQDAIRAASDRQAAAAKLSHVLEEALVQHLAATMLEHALREVEASTATNHRLARIGETFSLLTGGAYDRLAPAKEDKQSEDYGRLVAYETGGGEKHIGQLSEGTRDQLYLALRLVAIEDHVAAAPPLPFIADDILQTFDDTRARAALQALVGLSQHVQVIVLTHHPHLLALAQDLPVHVQRL